jgi:hypothetical protein
LTKAHHRTLSRGRRRFNLTSEVSHRPTDLLGIPDVDPWGNMSETFLECGDDGVVRVRDGRTLDEYINDPRLINRRRGKGRFAMMIGDHRSYETMTIPRCA